MVYLGREIYVADSEGTTGHILNSQFVVASLQIDHPLAKLHKNTSPEDLPSCQARQ
jgi:hypothetical protein